MPILTLLYELVFSSICVNINLSWMEVKTLFHPWPSVFQCFLESLNRVDNCADSSVEQLHTNTRVRK